jgi:exodeoxyribonuclease V alpha subunit
VGPGELLRCLIDCGLFPVVRLTRLFRQEEGGGITQAAHDVNAGGIPRFTPPGEEGECFFFPSPEPEEAAGLVVSLVKDRIPDRFGVNPFTDIQVLTPMHKGAAGTENLNRRLQEALNPTGGEEITRYGSTFRVQDKVMQVRNNYALDVFNGDIGFVKFVDREKGCMGVQMDDRIVSYPFENLDELMLAYCVSVHKSQGSEFPVVVIPLLTQHYLLLRRNLLYTGTTRAQKLLVVVGSEKAVRIAVSNSQTRVRYSRLEERLRSKEH